MKQLAIAAMVSCIVTMGIADTHAAGISRNKGTEMKSADRKAAANALATRFRNDRANASERARAAGYPVSGQLGTGQRFDLMGGAKGGFYYYAPLIANAVISANADTVRQTAPYMLSGNGINVGVWDESIASPMHREIGPRVSMCDDAYSISYHATAVAGIIGASGQYNPAYKGLAPAAGIMCYSYSDDIYEMMVVGASYPAEPGRIYVSNHSYGLPAGWEYGNFSGSVGYHLLTDAVEGSIPAKSSYFGQYGELSATIDQICSDLPYYLPVFACGNDRDDSAPPEGTAYWYPAMNNGVYTWSKVASYTRTNDAKGDGEINLGFDTIQPMATGKNTLAVGAVNDAVNDGQRALQAGSMSTFSGWGPTDDGRIKPDLVANGTDMIMIKATDDYSTSPASGTSFSAPVVSGAVALLQELASKRFGEVLSAAGTKALLLHTADDIAEGVATPGPDYSTGWGMLDVRAAADHLLAHDISNPALQRVTVIEDSLALGVDSFSEVYTWEGAQPIRVTIAWTDPAAPFTTALDDHTPMLVNDLDLRLVSVTDSTVSYPWTLDPANPAVAATTGDNTVDNVEQVLLPAPVAGDYRIEVTHKGTLVGDYQGFALMITGLAHMEKASVSDWQDMN